MRASSSTTSNRATPLLTTTDIAIPIRRAGQCADRARASRMPTPASRTLQNLGPLVFGNDALNLQQELVLRCTADRPVQEDDLGAAAAKLLDQEHLVGVASRQPVRRVHVNAFDLSARHRIAQLLQRRPLKVRAAPAGYCGGVVAAFLTKRSSKVRGRSSVAALS